MRNNGTPSPPPLTIDNSSQSNAFPYPSPSSSSSSSPSTTYTPNFHPSFLPVLNHLRTALCPLVSSTTGLQHPDFPSTLLRFHLLTSAQLDSLARHFHQVYPPLPATGYYPVMIPAWVGTAHEKAVDLGTKRRRFGRFIGLRGCESPTGDEMDVDCEVYIDWDGSGNAIASGIGQEPAVEESEEEMLARMEREWEECLVRARGDSEVAWRLKFGRL